MKYARNHSFLLQLFIRSFFLNLLIMGWIST